jgi:SAM-dependent methyltransferase
VSTSGAPPVCIACGAAPRVRYRLDNGANLVQCPRCLLGWWPWPAFDPAAFYNQDYFQGTGQTKGYDDYAALEAGVARMARMRLRIIRRLLRMDMQGGGSARLRLLELGCGTGVFLRAAMETGWEGRGIEVSTYAAEQARRRGLQVETGPVEDRSFGAAEFDCVALWDVLEHLRDPAGVLASAARALRPGGVLALSTGDVSSLCARLSGPRWHLFNLPEHLFFFSPASLRRLLQAAGCHSVVLRREPYWSPAAYVIERARKSGGPVGRVAALLAPVLRATVGTRLLPANLFDVLGVYAVHRGPSL